MLHYNNRHFKEIITKGKANKFSSSNIVLNKRIYYDYLIVEELEAGIALKGWEVKSLRSGKINICNSYVNLRKGEAFLLGANFNPLMFDYSKYIYESERPRKLLLHRYELSSIYGLVNHKGYTVVAISFFWKDAWCKVKIGVVKGKKQYDKRFNLKKRDWNLYKGRIMKRKLCKY